MDQYLPTISTAEYTAFRSINGMAEPPAMLGLPATYSDWSARQKAAVKRFESHKQMVAIVEVSLEDFREYIGDGPTKASLHDLWQCAKKRGSPWEAPRTHNPFARRGTAR